MYLILYCLISLLIGGECAFAMSPNIESENSFETATLTPPSFYPKSEGEITKLPPQMVTAARFRSDYKYVETVDGWLKLHHSPANWFDARARCQLEGTMLASPVNKEMLMAMSEIVNDSLSSACGGVHTGIHATYSKADFYTLDGIPLHNLTLQIKSNEELCSNELHDCMALEELGITNKRCEEILPFICFKKNKDVPLSLGKCTTVDPAYQLQESIKSCYKFHPEPRNWSDAFKTCSAEGAYLAIINGDAEAKHLTDLFKKYPTTVLTSEYKDSVFLGYRIFGNTAPSNNHPHYFFTIHGQSMEEAGYNRWSQGQPNGSGNCGGMFRSGLLNDIWCHVPYPFICEKNPHSY